MIQYLPRDVMSCIRTDQDKMGLAMFRSAMFNLLKAPGERTEKKMILRVSVGHNVKNGFKVDLSCCSYSPFLIIDSYKDDEVFVIRDGYNRLIYLNLAGITNLKVEKKEINRIYCTIIKYEISFSYHGGLDYRMQLVVTEKSDCKSLGCDIE